MEPREVIFRLIPDGRPEPFGLSSRPVGGVMKWSFQFWCGIDGKWYVTLQSVLEQETLHQSSSLTTAIMSVPLELIWPYGKVGEHLYGGEIVRDGYTHRLMPIARRETRELDDGGTHVKWYSDAESALIEKFIFHINEGDRSTAAQMHIPLPALREVAKLAHMEFQLRGINPVQEDEQYAG